MNGHEPVCRRRRNNPLGCAQIWCESAFHPVRPFAGRSRPSSALDPERTAQVDPKQSLVTGNGDGEKCPIAVTTKSQSPGLSGWIRDAAPRPPSFGHEMGHNLAWEGAARCTIQRFRTAGQSSAVSGCRTPVKKMAAKSNLRVPMGIPKGRSRRNPPPRCVEAKVGSPDVADLGRTLLFGGESWAARKSIFGRNYQAEVPDSALRSPTCGEKSLVAPTNQRRKL